MISLALATFNEESTIVDCLESCKGLVDEMVVVDGASTDRTAELARGMGAQVITVPNNPMFHINKQKAIDACRGEWVLQLDADERVTPELAGEIKQILQMTQREIEEYENKLGEKNLFERHQSIVQPNWDKQTGEYNAFFIPRLNFFLGGYLRSGGVYPDGVIRLIKKGKASLPCKDVHELMEVDGKTGWLANPLIHKDSPTFKRYLERNSRYIDRLVIDLKSQNKKSPSEMIDWVIVKPIVTFFSLTIRHKGIRDGWRGVVFAFFSAIRFARAYYRFSKESLGKLK